MASAASAFAALKAQTFSTTSLKRWSITSKPLPPPESITTIHIYDFDNTLFHTPLPNPQLWSGQTIGLLSNNDVLSNGGWWHDSAILAATGRGAAAEEPRAWSDNWNEHVVSLVQLSMAQPDALTILLTGRSEDGFSDLIKRMVTSKGLDFDMIGLKPKVSPDNETFSSTLAFKKEFLEQVMFTYPHATEIKVYEDRIKHAKSFRDFFAEFNHRMSLPVPSGPPRAVVRRPSISATVINIAENAKSLDHVIEVAEVQRMVDNHNIAVDNKTFTGQRLSIKRTVFFTSYGISQDIATRLLDLIHIPETLARTQIRYHATNILICARPCPRPILDSIGGLGAKFTWRVTATAQFNNTVWAARVTPADPTRPFHTDSDPAMVVLAVRKGVRPSEANRISEWEDIPREQQFEFETTVTEKTTLRIEAEDTEEDEYESLFAGPRGKRKFDDMAADEPPTRPSESRGRGGHGYRGDRGDRGGGNGYKQAPPHRPNSRSGGQGGPYPGSQSHHQGGHSSYNGPRGRGRARGRGYRGWTGGRGGGGGGGGGHNSHRGGQ